MTKHKKSNWMQQHQRDFFVQQSQKDNFRSRAVYKLKEINEKYRFLKNGKFVLDLGAAPGSWCQYLVTTVGKAGFVCAVDILPFKQLKEVTFIQGDFSSQTTQQAIQQKISVRGKNKFDVIVSDIAPNLSGNTFLDQHKMEEIVGATIIFGRVNLCSKGVLLFKAFNGIGLENVKNLINESFSSYRIIKPKASKAASKEVYLLAEQPK